MATTSNDHPGLSFIQAKGYTPGRPDGPPLWIVIHDMEAGESSDRAENTALYFQNPSDGRDVSAHYCVDNNSVWQCVDLDDVAWTVGNRPGNYRGINWELAGYARQTREEWLDPFGLAMFEQMAPYVRLDAQRFGIPLQRRTVEELKAFRPGITSHNDLRVAFGVTTHTDPGPNFPWDTFLAIMNGDDVTTADELLALLGDERIAARIRALSVQYPVLPGKSLLTVHREVHAGVQTLLSRDPAAPAEPVDPAALAAVLAEPLITALSAGIKDLVRAELDRTRLSAAE